MKINSISTKDSAYPARLKPIHKPPATIYSLGELPEYQLGVSIVGTRKPTAYGTQVTTELATKLSERGAVIISGLAYGVDCVAHKAVVNAGGVGIAVLAGGVDYISPVGNRQTANELLQLGGCILSEYPAGISPMQYRFLERNRIVAGLGDIVIVTEASLRSGTTNTVSHALEQGKDVYAVPGPITSPMSAGTNTLIAQGAQPIVDIDEFVERLFPKTTRKQVTLLAQNETEQTILDLLATGVQDGDELYSKSALDQALFAQTMTMLEIRGVIRALGGNRWGL